MENFSELHQVCLNVFESVSRTSSIFVLPLFMARIAFSNVLGESAKVFAALKGAVIYFCLIAAFPLIVEVLFSIPDAYLPKYESLNTLTAGSPGWDSSVIPFTIDRILEVVLAGLYWVVYYLHVFFMLIMCSMAPIVFLSSSLLGIGLGLEIFMGLLIVGSSWPIIWYGFDQVHAHLVSAQTDEFGAKCLELLLTLFKGLAPVAFAGIAVKSPPGKAIAQATKTAASSGRWLSGKASSASMIPIQSYQRYREAKQAAYFDRIRSLNPGWVPPESKSSESQNRLKKAKQQSQKGERQNENSRARNS
jgi:hypothetical protein